MDSSDFLLTARYTNRIELLKLCKNELQTIDILHSKHTKTSGFSNDGLYLAVAGEEGLLVYDVESKGTDSWMDAQSVLAVQFSPMNTYIAVLLQFHAENCVRNMKVYKFADKTEVYATTQKASHNWCPKWSNNEGYACLYQNGLLRFILCQNENEICNMPNINLQAFALSPNEGKYIVTFCRQIKGDPSTFTIYKKDDGQAVNQLRFYDIDEAELKWNCSGTAVLVLCQNTKTTKKSYYGESKLVLLNTTGDVKLTIMFNDNDENISVSDFNWSPISEEFVVVFDRSRAALFNIKGERIKVLSNQYGARNGVLFDTSGEFFALTGCGNVKGNFEIWHRSKQTGSKSVKPISGQIDVSYATMFKWCLGGHFLLAATTFPRLRQENGFRIFDLVGNCIFTMKALENNLVDVSWRPKLAVSFSENQLTRMLADLKVSKLEQSSKASTNQEKPTKYIPPHLRGQQEPSITENKCISKKKSLPKKKTLPPGLA